MRKRSLVLVSGCTLSITCTFAPSKIVMCMTTGKDSIYRYMFLSIHVIYIAPRVCGLPPVKGPCKALITRYFYNATSGVCQNSCTVVAEGTGTISNRFCNASSLAVSPLVLCIYRRARCALNPSSVFIRGDYS